MIPSAEDRAAADLLEATAAVLAGCLELVLGVKLLSMFVGVAALHTGVLDFSY